jgi:beta-1,4-mannosyl-glycoprotein beta-1,4-N-acetylglucosaminyltransferase
MILIDCFPYNGERVAEFRVASLYAFVDRFVIVEARQTHSGQQKEHLFFEQRHEAFEPFLDKITYLVIDEFPSATEEWLRTVPATYNWMRNGTEDAWWREMYQRNVGEEHVRSTYTGTPYIVVVSDADEIPSQLALQFCRRSYEVFTEGPVFLEMAFFYYHFRWIKKERWYHAFVMNDRSMRTSEPWNTLRIGVPRSRVLPMAGWHCSYFASKEDLRRKLASFAHRECDKEQFKTDEHLRACLLQGRDISNRGPQEDLIWYTGDDLPTGWQELQADILRIQEM